MKFNCAIERLLLSFSLAVTAIACGQLPLRAEATNPVPETPMRQKTDRTSVASNQLLPSASFSSNSVTSQATIVALTAVLEPAVQFANPSAKQVDSSQVDAAADSIAPAPVSLAVPVPGTVPTSAAALDLGVTPATVESQNSAQSVPSVVAQADAVEPGRATRSGSSYVGVGANIGSLGRTPLGSFSGAILSKIGLTNIISVRPAVLIDGDATFLIPVTLDFPIERAGRVSFAPYVGVGASFSTGDRKNADFIVTGGVDVPLSSQFTLTASATAGLINGVDLGVLVGVGYNFAGF